MRLRFGKRSGYLLSVVAAGLAVITIGCLIVAAYASKGSERNDEYRARLEALYAAESGLLVVEKRLRNPKTQVPKPGNLASGELPRSKSRYRCEVLESGRTSKSFLVTSSGRAETADFKVVTVELTAAYRLEPKKGWRAEWRVGP